MPLMWRDDMLLVGVPREGVLGSDTNPGVNFVWAAAGGMYSMIASMIGSCPCDQTCAESALNYELDTFDLPRQPCRVPSTSKASHRMTHRDSVICENMCSREALVLGAQSVYILLIYHKSPQTSPRLNICRRRKGARDPACRSASTCCNMSQLRHMQRKK